MSDRTDARLVRLLGIVTFLDRVGESTVDQLATRFGVTPGQIASDIDTLWVSGLPGYWPQDLLDFDAHAYESGIVRITRTQGLERPLRLGAREAVALGAALRTLQALMQQLTDDPDVVQVIESTLAALNASTGDSATPFDVSFEQPIRPDVLEVLREAQSQGRAVDLVYADANDVTSTRTVRPLALSSGDGRTYLDAWSLDADARRTYRLDRILAATLSDRAVPVPTEPGKRAAGTATQSAHPFADASTVVDLTLRSSARSVAESVPYEELRQHHDGSFTLSLRVANLPWLEQLVLAHADEVVSMTHEGVVSRVHERASAALAAYARAGFTAPSGPGTESSRTPADDVV